ncbi:MULTISPECIES: hypothetical protein [unclassified Proteiniphilum]|jgi:hypothetical protein|uniref:hypothetical protein n=1 Tax=unclassified Proteiniphilum TaxID=2622718 RepID=UPI00257E7B8D|nr:MULTISPECIES: hypothetical protein [unclassified Proteiniphilum]MEA4995323.1 hypothetical protein [Petrimonas sp.]MEA5063884.1 hypothetical protein [Petrimonas sp.]MEA5128013.1 hypothetical protein [Proteiniphilum sp.]HMM18861.1 hypothetical protein [Petrimonas sp.]
MKIVYLVGISTNYVKQDFGLKDSIANLLPLSLFLWCAILSVPTNRINTWPISIITPVNPGKPNIGCVK